MGPSRSLLRKLLLATLGPAIVVLLAFGVLAHETARRSFDAELGKRLAAAAQGAALLVQPYQLEAIDPADEGSATYATVRRRLATARAEFGVRRVALVARDLGARGDTSGRIPLGARAHEFTADLPEIEQAIAGRAAASVLFWDAAGPPFNRAYAAVGDPAVGVVVVEGSADYFASLAAFRRWLVAGGGVGLGLVVLVTILVARQITRPLGRLAQAAEAIGRGELTTTVPVETRDEVGQLAARLDEMRAALRTRDERLQMMLAGIAHEVRNPLGGLELYAGLLRDALADEPDRLEEVRRIEREIGYLKEVVSEFLDYARRPPAEAASVPLRGLLEEVAEVARAGKGTALRVDAADVVVRGDRGQLRRALLNLARNALTAAGDAGAVVLAARDEGRSVLCEVRDSGPGVPPELAAKIFDPFFTTRERGTGLGLAGVRDSLRDHGAAIEVARAPEGGAAFRFRLPTAGEVS